METIIMAVAKSTKNREERRSAVIKKATASKESAKSFLVKAGIVNKKGTLTKRYK